MSLPELQIVEDRGPQLIRVLHVADCEMFDRFGRMFRHLAFALNAENVQVGLATDDPAAVHDLETTPVTCLPCRALAGWQAWGLRRELERRLDPLPQVVHLWGTTCLDRLAPWARAHGIPLLVHVLSRGDVEQLARGCLRRARQGAPVASSGREGGLDAEGAAPFHGSLCCAAGCSALADELRRQAPGVTVILARPAMLIPSRAVTEVSDAHTLGLVWSGRFGPDCGLELLIAATGLLRRRGCDLQVVLLGAGPPSRGLRAQIRAENVQDCVSVLDEPDLWDRGMSGADAYVVPNRQEDLALTPLLAMALGKVIIAARGQMAEWFIENRTCWFYSPGVAAELAQQLGRVAEGDDRVQSLRESACAYAREHHAIGHLAEPLVAAYRRIAAGAAQPS